MHSGPTCTGLNRPEELNETRSRMKIYGLHYRNSADWMTEYNLAFCIKLHNSTDGRKLPQQQKDDNGDELVRTCDPVTIREWEANEAALRREDAPGRNCSLPEDNNARGCTGRLLEILYLALIHIVALIHNRDDENPAIMEESLFSEEVVRGPNGVGFNISPSGVNSMEIKEPPAIRRHLFITMPQWYKSL